MAKGVNRQRRGRTLVFLGLVGFFAVAVVVVLRRASGRAKQYELEALERQRTQLAGEAAQLDAELRALASRGRLAPLVEKTLGMRVPAVTQVIDLTLPEAPDGAP